MRLCEVVELAFLIFLELDIPFSTAQTNWVLELSSTLGRTAVPIVSPQHIEYFIVNLFTLILYLHIALWPSLLSLWSILTHSNKVPVSSWLLR
jgi:hypothetical protein